MRKNRIHLTFLAWAISLFMVLVIGYDGNSNEMPIILIDLTVLISYIVLVILTPIVIALTCILLYSIRNRPTR
jgi:hypothetical protein